MALIALCAAAPLCAADITIAPGTGPAGQYYSLSVWGITPIAGMGDNTEKGYNTPAFNFGGKTFTHLNISSNGYVTMNSPATSANPQTFPDPTSPNGVLAPFWTDLDPSQTGAVRIGLLTDGTNTWIVVDWNSVSVHGYAGVTDSFEIWLRTGGVEDITYSYGSMLGSAGLSSLIGAENINGTIGATYLGALPYNSELRVTTSGGPNLVPEPAGFTMLGLGLSCLGLLRLKKRA